MILRVLMGQSGLNFVHPDDRKQSEHAPRRMLADGITDRKVIRFRSRLNRWRRLEEMSRCFERARGGLWPGVLFRSTWTGRPSDLARTIR